MKNLLLTAAIIALSTACQSDKNSEQTTSPTGVHTAVVEEVLQTNQYTYLHVKEGNAEPWLALPKMQAATGETYYYIGGLLMTDFASKELNRTFKEILFLDNISTNPNITAPSQQHTSSTPGTSAENNANQTPSVAHTVVAEEVVQTSQYTYIRAKEGNQEFWLAASKMEVGIGTTYYFNGGLPMTKFESKELKRTFDEILFLDNISTSPSAIEKSSSAAAQNNPVASTGSSINIEKKEIKIKHAKDDITIAALLENKKTYAGKIIKMKGEVTKFSPGIMKKNWIHLQDGTDFSGKFDLTITTDQEVKIGDNITIEGVITLDKDFGFGYFYEVIMEDAKLKK